MELVKVVECDCGWTFRGPEEELVAATMRHAREVHRLELTREQVLAAAKPAVQEDGRPA
jgi:predicted small metal-binding protein